MKLIKTKAKTYLLDGSMPSVEIDVIINKKKIISIDNEKNILAVFMEGDKLYRIPNKYKEKFLEDLGVSDGTRE